MKFNSSVLLAATTVVLARSSSAQILPAPIQEYYVPLEETNLLGRFFDVNRDAVAPVRTLISIAISTDNTTIYYDHWEGPPFGYDRNWNNPSVKQSNTLIWGDGDASNGCAPLPERVVPCTNQNDRLLAGDIIVLENDVQLPRNARTTVFDAGDRIGATLPIAVTRGAYPAGAGSLLAGAVEVQEVGNWGNSYRAPVGQNLYNAIAPEVNTEYQLTSIAVGPSLHDNNVIRRNGQIFLTLQRTQSTIIGGINQNDIITFTHPMQADLIAGDHNSNYEMRWYSLPPVAQWTNEYYAPVGDTLGGTRVTVYNPSSSSITVSVQTSTRGYSLAVPRQSSVQSEIIPDGSGARFSSNNDFYAFSSTYGDPTGEWSDWGYPLIPSNQLTSVALIGLGYGCTDNVCDSRGARNVDWVTPVEAGYIHVDFNNDGQSDMSVPAQALESVYFRDSTDQDLTGAVFWATKGRSPMSADPVKIAAAWGQKRSLASSERDSSQERELDLGTVVIPFEPFHATCRIVLSNDNDNNGEISAGDVVTEVIEVINAGPTSISSGRIAVDSLTGRTIVDPTTARGGRGTYNRTVTVTAEQMLTEDCNVTIIVLPTPAPSSAPSMSPSSNSAAPFISPSSSPSLAPTVTASMAPTVTASMEPTVTASMEPTVTASMAPTAPKTPYPTPSPTHPKTLAPTNRGSSSGDPHFKTWTGEKYDYHGECDLVLVDHPPFDNGVGLRVHIRTTRVHYFSFIEKGGLQIGDDVLEFDNDVESFLINGVKAEEKHGDHKTMLNKFFVRRDKKALSVRLDTPGKAKIDFHTRKNGFPAVIVDGGHTDIFKGSLGLLGDWSTGHKLARDRKTEFTGINGPEDDATAFALEWQVRGDEPNLFAETRIPQFPTTCFPAASRPKGKLGESLLRKEAEEACAHWRQEDQEDCVFDVMATRDTLVAEEGHIIHIE